MLSGPQFSALWAQTGQDRIPYPFKVTSTLATADEYEAEQRRIRADFSGPEHDPLGLALLVLAEPDLRIEISGSAGVDGGTSIRMTGALARGHGIAAVQHPGAEVVIRSCEPYDVGRQLIAQLPDTDPGTAAGIVVPPTPAGSAQAARILDRPSTSQGVVTVVRGSRHSPRPVGGLAWRDIEGDGRYLVWGDTAVAVEPGTSWDLLDAVTRLTGRIAAGHPV
ncbi:ESX secretion-associated protein EspG [Rhodococcus sp. IEGM 1305]|uniref:ESX secretion-associated protein EspG n=1 Tax=Rhodococcus sp. IEGM 1305 TaxID=3047092 RepID=UPI0024B7FAC4|nr:ESX secretion-associated protein EspG [Rhodococcus sp. IEGM 1305]MDI9951976.1 ESX secretion-associated protein EspG [Rhodococcus sp. IEGM 1305]